MLILPSSSNYIFRLGIALGLVMAVSTWALAQDAVKLVNSNVAYLLPVEPKAEFRPPTVDPSASAQSFDFSNKLILFTASVDGRQGNFILDTGAPEVLINDRGLASSDSAPVGIAAGGEVNLSDYFINSFVLTGKEHRKMWAYSLDLRPLEERLDQSVDGFVGYNMLSQRELRVDYQAQTFQLLASTKKPLHEGRSPDHSIPFTMEGHLPVITVKVGKQKLRLALDTGASISLLDKSVEHLSTPLLEKINVQGLDGQPQVANLVTLDLGLNDGTITHQPPFALFDLPTELDKEEGQSLKGILGSDYLSKFVVGIDYRRRRLYLWKPILTK